MQENKTTNNNINLIVMLLTGQKWKKNNPMIIDHSIINLD